MDTDALKEKLADHGTVLACRVVFNEKGKSARFGFATVQNGEEALAVVEALNGVDGMEAKIAEQNLYKKKEEERKKELNMKDRERQARLYDQAIEDGKSKGKGLFKGKK